MQCPFCKEEIIEGALKCKHCGSNLVSPPQTAAHPAEDFGAVFSNALNLWKNNLSDLVVLTLVFLLVCWIPIANIGFIAGYIRSLTKVAKKEGRAQVSDIFSAWDCFGNLFVYLLLYLVASCILNFVPFLGTLASLALGFMIVPGFFAIVGNKFSAIDAVKWDIETIQADLTNWLLAYIIGGVIFFAGFILILIGAILTVPLGQLIMILQYERSKPV